MVLTVDDKASEASPDPERNQELLKAKDRTDALEGIKRGLQSMKRDAGKPAEAFFEEFFAEKGISEHE